MINNSYLLGLFGASSMATSPGYGLSTPSIPKKVQPTAPWAPAAEQPQISDMLRSALAGRPMINENAVSVDVKDASADYEKLFALYQGLNTISALADHAKTKGLSTAEMALTSKRFAAGIAEITDYLKAAKLEDVRLVPGVSKANVKSSAGVEKAPTTYTTAPIHDGMLSDPVKAFEGDVRFSMTVKAGTTSQVVDFDLSEMGIKMRTMDNVVAYMNDKLSAAGVSARMSRERIEGEPRIITSGDKTVTLPAGPDTYALKVTASAAEQVSFGAVDTSDAVYVTQGVGTGKAAQLLKFQADGGAAPEALQGVGESYWIPGRAGSTDLPEGVDAIRASAVAPDGSVWIVADLTAGLENQPIKGARDVALMKYDSAGNLMQSKVLGAASSANGFSIAIDDDGRVALAGSVVGALEPGVAGASPTAADSFVSVFDSDGKELWTQRRGARAADEATEVGFGADGMVYVAGRAQSAMPGGVASGGWDSYLQTFQETPVLGLKDRITAVNVSTLQFGTAGDDSTQAMTVSGSDVYTAGVEDGRAVVRRFTLDADGKPVLASTRDFGAASGEIAGIAVENGKVVVTGHTNNSALDIANVTNPHAGGSDVFVVALSADLQPSTDDRLTYFGGAGDDTAADVEVRNGKVWITGTNREEGDYKKDDPTGAYLARLDLATGAVESNQTWRAENDQARPTSLSFAEGGASVLDRLGLPQGEALQADSRLLTVATSLRAGDQFTISPAGGGRAVTVTIDGKDTLDTLAKKINSASNRQLEARVTTDYSSTPPVQRLQINPAANRPGAVISAGPAGKDALAGLGLTPGFVGKTADTDDIKTFGLNLPATLNLNDKDSITAAVNAIASAMTSVKSAYRALAPETQTNQTITNTLTGRGSSTAYQQAQLANFQAALSRLLA